jgi:oligopeptide/dipeptide ABC transporter ATP-binding protein
MPSTLAPDNSPGETSPLLEIQRLTVRFDDGPKPLVAVDQVSFAASRGETVGIVGASGSGKTQILLAIMGLLSGNATASGSVRLNGADIIGTGDRRLDRLRGSVMSMVFQDPMIALNPFLRISTQLTEAMVLHRGISAASAAAEAAQMLDRLSIPGAAWRIHQYPHELSGGMRQRVLIAMALLCGPALLLADEPTTALDMTVQARTLDVLREAIRASDMTMLLVTHDLGVVAASCQRVIVLDRGCIVEQGPVDTVFTSPQHAVTQGLLASFPRIDGPLPPVPVADPAVTARSDVAGGAALLRTEDLHVHFAPRRFGSDHAVRALDGITLEVRAGETLGVVGESGCGKSTLCRAVLGLIPPSAGRVLWRGVDLGAMKGKRLRQQRRHIQMVFQDAVASLDPRMTVRSILERQLSAFSTSETDADRNARLLSTLQLVGAEKTWLDRFPHELSSGQCQRVAIARALMVEPDLLVCDEPVSSLDSKVQVQVMNLLLDLQHKLGLGCLFVSHNMAAIRQMSHRVLVIYLGKVVEMATRDAFFRRPLHPYSQALLDAVLAPDPRVKRAATPYRLGREASLSLREQSGCRFRDRCPAATDLCAEVDPPLQDHGGGHFAACHYAGTA